MNKAFLVGRLTVKPELRYNSTNIPYTRFSIAVNRQFKSANGERETDFINVVLWRKQAENVCQYLDKGSLVSVEGRIQTGSYTDQNGNKRYTTDIVADNVQFLESKNAQKNGNTVQKSENSIDEQTDIFKDFGDEIATDDNFLE